MELILNNPTVFMSEIIFFLIERIFIYALSISMS